MSEWYAKYETGFTVPANERDYIEKTLTGFNELTNDEIDKINLILKETRQKSDR